MRDIILLVSLVAVSLAFEECGRQVTGRRSRSSDQVGKRQTIYGPLGQTAEHGEFPWQVMIMTSNHRFVCGGALIEKNWVLTAAHCFGVGQDWIPHLFDVRVGVWRQKAWIGTEQEIRVKKIIKHEDFKRATMENDIALIQLAKNADCSSQYVGTACLPNSWDDLQDYNCWGSGWGKWLKPAPAPAEPDKLQKFMGQIPADSFVKSVWTEARIFDGMIGFVAPLIEGERSAFCDGDSGAPVVCPSKTEPNKFYVVGIASWGAPTCKIYNGYTDILTSVTHFYEWIKDTTVEWGG